MSENVISTSVEDQAKAPLVSPLHTGWATTDNYNFLWACDKPDVGVQVALVYMQKEYGKSFVLTFYSTDNTKLTSYLIENETDLYDATLAFGESPSASYVSASSNRHTTRR